MKRLFDIFFSLVFLIVFLPFFLIIALFIIIESGFPVFFIQQRIGVNKNPFDIIKFRTMTVLHEARHGSFDAGDCSRVTKVGKFLRGTKLDELPQLLNVLFGHMSFVGPRPEVKKWVDAYPLRWDKVLTVRPGITDNASIEFVNEEIMLNSSDDPQKTYHDDVLPRKLDLYELYVNEHSFLGDIKILFKTLVAVVFK